MILRNVQRTSFPEDVLGSSGKLSKIKRVGSQHFKPMLRMVALELEGAYNNPVCPMMRNTPIFSQENTL